MKLGKFTIVICCLLVTYETPAHAYLDPGTGSILIQGLIASIAAAGVVLRTYWHRLVHFFGIGKDKGRGKDDDHDNSSHLSDIDTDE